MIREFSAGAVAVRRMRGNWWMAAIQPQGQSPAASGKSKQGKVLALPKGLIDAGERPQQTALRELREEAGIDGEVVSKLGDVKYVYVRRWSDGEKVFKVVSFFLVKYKGGSVENITPEMRREISRALWLRLDEAPRKLAYGGERQMARAALSYLQSHPGV